MDNEKNINNFGEEEKNVEELYSSAPNKEVSEEIEESTVTEIKTEKVENEEPTQTVSEPTVQFEAVNKEPESKNTGIKVFFSLIAVTVALVLALTAGFVFGKANGDTTFNITAPGINSNQNMTVTDYAGAYNKVKNSVVHVFIYNEKSVVDYNISGIIYSTDGYIIINDCVYAEMTSPEFIVTLHDGSECKAKYVAGDTRSNLAVLKIDAKNLTPATFGDYTELKLGEQVVVVGRENGNSPLISSGIVSSAGTRVSLAYSSYSLKVIKTDILLSGNGFGAALVNMYGQIVGINTDSVYGYAIPSTTMVNVVDSLIKKGYVEGRGKLGVTYTFIETYLAEINNLPKGMLIQSVSSDSPLDAENVKQGDVITHINDVELKSSDVALDIIEKIKPGETLSLKVYHTDSKTSEVIYTTLSEDKGSSSYTESIIGGETEGNNGSGIFSDDSDSFSDH